MEATLNTFTTGRIDGLLAVRIAVLSALGVTISFSPLLLLVGGLVYGSYTQADHDLRVIVAALALAAFASGLQAVPEIGTYLEASVDSIAKVAQGAALLIILRNLYKCLTPASQAA